MSTVIERLARHFDGVIGWRSRAVHRRRCRASVISKERQEMLSDAVQLFFDNVRISKR